MVSQRYYLVMTGSPHSLTDLLGSLCRLMRAEQRTAGEGDLQPVHLEALGYLARANRYSNTAQALTDYLGATKGTVSQSLLVLYRRGLIERETDRKDRRIVRLRLSAAGRKMATANARAGRWQAALDRLPGHQREAAQQALAELLRQLQRARGGRTFGVCRSCAHFRRESGHRLRCGLTGEALGAADAGRICREHEAPGT